MTLTSLECLDGSPYDDGSDLYEHGGDYASQERIDVHIISSLLYYPS
jgi:hypothetical protein